MEIEITSGGEMLQHGVPVASVSFRRPYFDRQIAGTYYSNEYDTDAARLEATECQLADEKTLTVRFSSLPLDVREAVLMWDQQSLPLGEHIEPEFDEAIQ